MRHPDAGDIYPENRFLADDIYFSWYIPLNGNTGRQMKKSLDAVGFESSRGVGKIDIIPHEKPEVRRLHVAYYRSVIKMGFIGKTDRILPSANILGSALDAITFSTTIDDHYDMREFIDGWMHGDVDDWPEYQQFLKKKSA